jgi:hypothetical protein
VESGLEGFRKFRNSEIQKFRNPEIQKSRNSEIQKFRNPETSGNAKNSGNFSNF